MPRCPSGQAAGDPLEDTQPPTTSIDVQAPGETCGSGLLSAASTLSLKVLGWNKSHRGPLLLSWVGEGCGQAAADSGCLQPPSLFLAPTWPRAAELLEQTRSLGCCQGNSSSSRLTPAQSPLGDVGRASQNLARGALPRWQPRSARGWQQCSQPLPVLHPQTHAELSPLHPREAGSVGEGRWREDLEEEAS